MAEDQEQTDESGAVKAVRSAFVVFIEPDGTPYATNGVRDIIIDDNGVATLLEPEEPADIQTMLRATREVLGDIELQMTVQAVTQTLIPNLLQAQMQMAQRMAQQQQDQAIAGQVLGAKGGLHVPGR
jgi:hypothetical protein